MEYNFDSEELYIAKQIINKIMKTINIIFLVLFVSLKIQSQNYSELIFDEQFNALITERLGYAPTVFEVVNKEYKTTTKTASKKLSQAYIDAVQEVKNAENDSANVALKIASRLEKSNEIDRLRNYIDNFLKSNEPYELKKEVLKNAQKISTKYSLGYLIYADSEVNSHFKSKFFDLSMDKLDLKVHLNKIIWDIDTNQKSELESFSFEEANSKLTEAREHLAKINRFDITEGVKNVDDYNVLTLGDDVVNPEKEIYGHYETLGEYYVVTGVKEYKPEQLVPAKEIEKKQIQKENLVFEIPIVLIQHSITKSNYLVSPEFLDQYAINRVAAQEKFKGKIASPKKIYRNEKEKLYDSLIFDYNKSHIASMTDFD